MNDHEQKNRFADRLARIDEAKRANPQYQEDQSVQRGQRTGRAGASPMLRVFFAAGLMLVVVAGGMFAAKMMKDAVGPRTAGESSGGGLGGLYGSVGEAFLNGVGRRELKPVPKDAALFKDPTPGYPYTNKPFEAGRLGFDYGPGHAFNASREAIAMEKLVEGWTDNETDAPALTVLPFAPNAECQMRRPRPGEKLISVLIGDPYRPAQLRSLMQDDIVTKLVGGVKSSLSQGEFPHEIEIDRGEVERVDVVVTDTSGPLHLVLQGSNNVVWNIIPSEGVKIAHISLVSGGQSGLTGDIGDASFDAIRASDFGPYPQFSLSQREERKFDCMAHPIPAPKEYWTSHAGAAKGDTVDANLLFMRTKGAAAYATWFRDSFGVSAETNFIVADGAANVLVGPVPSAPLPAAPYGSTVLHFPSADHVISGDDQSREAATERLFTDILDKAAGRPYREFLPLDVILDDPSGQAQRAERVFDGLVLGMDFADDRGEIRAKMQQEAINDERRVIFETHISLADVLQPGETPPTEALAATYVRLRVPELMTRYCEDTVSAMARRCGFLKATVSPLRDGNFQVRATFGFVQNYDIGTLDAITGGGFISAFLPGADLNQKFATPAERKALIGKYLRVCDRLREEYGNCLLGTLSFHLADKPASYTNGVKAHAAGWVEVYALDQPLEEEKLQARAAEIFAEIDN